MKAPLLFSRPNETIKGVEGSVRSNAPVQQNGSNKNTSWPEECMVEEGSKWNRKGRTEGQPYTLPNYMGPRRRAS